MAWVWPMVGGLVGEAGGMTTLKRHIGEPRTATGPGGGAGETLRAMAEAAARGDRGAFERLHARLTPGLRASLRARVGGREDVADDLVQKTWAAVWRALECGGYDPAKSAISTFVFAVGHHQWVSSVRRLAAETNGSRASVEVEAEDAEASATLAELLEDLRACLRGEGVGAGVLNEEERELARLVAGGLGDRAIAGRLGISASTANVRKRGMLEVLLRFLVGRGHRAERVRPLLEPAERGGPGDE
jgi:RNA polymerase sigma factor (sigma-70 family)